MSALSEYERHEAWQDAQYRAYTYAEHADKLISNGQGVPEAYYRRAEVWALVATALRRDVL